jgi:ribonuclease VapC
VSEVVLDASALLAVVLAERGAESVAETLDEALISSVNLSETAAVLVDAGIPLARVRARLSRHALTTVPFDEEDALVAAELRTLTCAAGLSLGDRACLALAQRRKLPALTADRAWAELDLGIEVRLIR